MPGISTTAIGDPETRRMVEEAHRAVDTGPRMGILEERNEGTVPVHLDGGNPPYAGVTEIDTVYHHGKPRAEARRIGINSKIPTYARIGDWLMNYTGRVSRHEFTHMMSTPLLDYMHDLTDNQRTLIMESLAEFADIRRGNKKGVMLTTPYPRAVKFAYMADTFYESELDGQKGYEAFIRDIQLRNSGRAALDNLGRNIRAAVNRGVDVLSLVESKYGNELHSARRDVGLKPYLKAA